MRPTVYIIKRPSHPCKNFPLKFNNHAHTPTHHYTPFLQTDTTFLTDLLYFTFPAWLILGAVNLIHPCILIESIPTFTVPLHHRTSTELTQLLHS